ncbi:disulfide bond formation protein DsbA [Arcobacter suis]|uniref:Protein disulfide isomerase n=1 Tax=Arcobacter suis CECT 7833 TaxID=663365 RepID=A0AAD0SPS7_9BACT|nr:thioredoxin domain-containing protein [Arcobacter suis]AXX88864.1 protein disulfide isomerase [Arcobacter suis CECT 7833]RWS47421.1 disulfide bond formation protein DsbA [Arcobacter suis]
MNKFSKILSISILLSSALYATSSDENVINFEQKRISQNPNVKIKNIKISTKKELPLKGWNGYILDVEATVQGKDINAKDILFSDGKYISLELIDSETGKSLKDLVTPNLTDNYHDKSKLIAGNHNAKDKIVIFSDPLCPFCKDYVPDVIKYVNKNSNNIALYYYHFPLMALHPAAAPLSKLIEIAKEKGIKDVEVKVYETDWEKYFDVKSVDETKILEAFNKEFNTSIKLEEISSSAINAVLEKDISMGEEVMVSGTPTIFVNKVKDSTKLKYETLGKK